MWEERGMSENSIIPKELFQPAADVANNLINKISDAVGYIVEPRGKRKDKEEAVAFLTEKIRNDSEMPPLVKAAAISNVRQMIQKYSNQNDIINLAMQQLNTNAQPEKVDNDWIADFLDKAQNISKDEMQKIFARILAKECEQKGSISKQLINILSIIDSDLADAFKRLCKYLVLIKFINKETNEEEEEAQIIIGRVSKLEENHMNLQYMEIVELSNIGLISFVSSGEYTKIVSITEFVYGPFSYKVKSIPPDGYLIGQVALTTAGAELASIFVREYELEYIPVLDNFFKVRGYEVEKEYDM